jgi:hypothetical protein
LRALTLAAVVVASLLVLPAVALANSDLEVTQFTASQNPVPEEGPDTFNVTVRNNGPDPAPSVEVKVTVPASLFTFVSANSGTGTIATGANTVTYSFGTIASGGTASGASLWTGIHPGTDTAKADAEFTGTETNDGTNHPTLGTTVTGLTLSGGAFPDQIIGTAGPLTPIVITNHSSVTTSPAFSPPTGDVGDFALAGSCAAPLPPETACSLNFRFLPSALGPRVAHLSFFGTGNIDAVPIDFTGKGIPFPTTAGPAGPQGPAGPAGPAAFKLVVVPVNAKLRSRTGKRVTFSYVSTLDAQATLDVLKGSKRVARVRGTATTGLNKLRWNGKAGRKAASAGRYKLRLTAVNGDQKVTANATLTLTRR